MSAKILRQLNMGELTLRQPVSTPSILAQKYPYMQFKQNQ